MKAVRLGLAILTLTLLAGQATAQQYPTHPVRILVTIPPGGFPIIEVPPDQADQVHQLLIEKGIGHTVASRLMRDNPLTPLSIHFGKLWNREQIQDALDSVP